MRQTAHSRRISIPALAIFGVFVAAYLGLSPSLAHQHFDSLNYAYACEEYGVHKLWGNHPLGHVLQCGAFGVARRFGYDGRALGILAALNGVATAAAMAAFFLVMTSAVRASLPRSVGWTLLLGGAYGMWHDAGTAEIYGLAILFLIVAWAALVWSFERPSAARTVLSGLAVGVATVTHQLNGVLLAAGTLGLLSLPAAHTWRRRIGVAVALATVAALTIGAGYAALGVLTSAHPSPEGILEWAVGHGNNPIYGRFFHLHGAAQALGGLAGTLLYGSQRGPEAILLFGSLAMGSALLFVSVLRIRQLPRRAQSLALSCGLTCMAGWLLIVWWEPYVVGKFWLLTLPAAAIWGDTALAALKGAFPDAPDGHRTWRLEVVPLVAGVLLFSATAIVLARERRHDMSFEQSLTAWAEHTDVHDLLIDSGDLTPHLLFWLRRPGTFNLVGSIVASRDSADRFATARSLIDATIQRGDSVWFTPGLTPYLTDQRLAVIGVTRQQVMDFFAQYQQEGPVFQYRGGTSSDVQLVYRLGSRRR